MDLFTTMLLSIIPAALLMMALLQFDKNSAPSDRPRSKAREELLFLSGVCLVLLLIGEAIAHLPIQPGSWLIYGMPVLLLPTELCALALILITLPEWLFLKSKERIVLSIFFAGIASLLALSLSRMAQVGEILPASLPIVLAVLLISRRLQGLLWFLNVLYLALLILLNNDLFQRSVMQFSPTTRAIISILFLSTPSMTVVLSATTMLVVLRRIDHQQPDLDNTPSKRIPWNRAIQIGFVILMICTLTYSIFWTSIWDQTSDGLGGIFLTMFSTPAAIAVGLLMVRLTTGPRRWVGAVFIVAVPLLTYAAFTLGWGMPYKQWTEQRAAQIQHAIEQYHDQTGQYPKALSALVPRYLLVIPNPIILRGEDWCYQGESDQYRLGAYYREFFSSPLSIQIYASAGNPQDPWSCEDRLVNLKARYDPQVMPQQMVAPSP